MDKLDAAQKMEFEKMEYLIQKFSTDTREMVTASTKSAMKPSVTAAEPPAAALAATPKTAHTSLSVSSRLWARTPEEKGKAALNPVKKEAVAAKTKFEPLPRIIDTPEKLEEVLAEALGRIPPADPERGTLFDYAELFSAAKLVTKATMKKNGKDTWKKCLLSKPQECKMCNRHFNNTNILINHFLYRKHLDAMYAKGVSQKTVHLITNELRRLAWT
ncbi:hypothetical protein PFISCL1PPCAC_6715 [Pristionchus fissidentatus]|uniref:C2H2-type domain-containing protein n=1 Tax=Pristionchus fissidentatus TaxID=1538716 RepID=A0AAV5VB24_9BILA|nr:hypothetical protein PFISCL1PPCAC_6715 [Pristionchus fissidentatus]